MGDVEKATICAAVESGVYDRVFVLDGHAPAGERNHLTPVFHVEIVQHSLLEVGLRREASPGGSLAGDPSSQGLTQLPQCSPHAGN